MIATAVQDRRRLARDGLCLLFEAQPDVEVIGVVASPLDLLPLCERQQPEVVVFQADGLPETIDALALVRDRCPRVHMIGVYTCIERRPAEEMLEGGAHVLLNANGGIASILEAIRDRAIMTDLDAFDFPHAEVTPLLALTDRERQVLRLVGTGSTTREISAHLGISSKTVENHKHRIFTKLDVHNQAHAVSIAVRTGLIDPGGDQWAAEG
jgi:DNA-binding NarL/FixJ family response regulator